MNIWAPIAIPQFASLFGPDLASVSARAVLVLSTGIYGQWIQKKYYSKLMEHVKKSIKADPGRRFYITGHSLGGGLAKLVTMETKIPAITFSSPGVENTRLLVSPNRTTQDEAASILHDLSFTVIPNNDIVPRIDSQLGTTIQIDCSESPLACHAIGETLCGVLHMCGASSKSTAYKHINCNLCPAHRHLFAGCNKLPLKQNSLQKVRDVASAVQV